MVSIITPVFNGVNFIGETMGSVRDQTWSEWEHIIVDDGSTDGSVELIKREAASDCRVRLLQTGGRQGPAKARNRALESARGKYVAFLDADDLWLPEKLERCMTWMKEKNHSFIYHDYRHMSSDGKRVGALIEAPERLDFRTLHTRRGHGGCLSIVIDREKIVDFKFPVQRRWLHEDFIAWLWIVRKGHVGHRLAEDLGRYRISSTSRSGKKFACAAEAWRIYRTESQLPFGRALNWWTQYTWRAYWMHMKAAPR